MEEEEEKVRGEEVEGEEGEGETKEREVEVKAGNIIPRGFILGDIY